MAIHRHPLHAVSGPWRQLSSRRPQEHGASTQISGIGSVGSARRRSSASTHGSSDQPATADGAFADTRARAQRSRNGKRGPNDRNPITTGHRAGVPLHESPLRRRRTFDARVIITRASFVRSSSAPRVRRPDRPRDQSIASKAVLSGSAPDARLMGTASSASPAAPFSERTWASRSPPRQASSRSSTVFAVGRRGGYHAWTTAIAFVAANAGHASTTARCGRGNGRADRRGTTSSRAAARATSCARDVRAGVKRHSLGSLHR